MTIDTIRIVQQNGNQTSVSICDATTGNVVLCSEHVFEGTSVEAVQAWLEDTSRNKGPGPKGAYSYRAQRVV
jgi:hypothetical protein